jgi:hypothetical protein
MNNKKQNIETQGTHIEVQVWFPNWHDHIEGENAKVTSVIVDGTPVPEAEWNKLVDEEGYVLPLGNSTFNRKHAYDEPIVVECAVCYTELNGGPCECNGAVYDTSIAYLDLSELGYAKTLTTAG